MNWLLVIVLAILIVNALIGRKVGFIKMVFSLTSLIITLVLTSMISPTVNDLMKNNEKFYNLVLQKVEVILPSEEDIKKNEQITYIEELPLPHTMKDRLIENNNADIYKKLVVKSFKDYVSNYLANVVINAMAFILTFVVILVLLWILCIALNIISKLPILNQINKTAGMLAGLIQGFIIVWIFFLIITIFGGTKLGQEALMLVEENDILSFLYGNNFLLNFITSAAKLFF